MGNCFGRTNKVGQNPFWRAAPVDQPRQTNQNAPTQTSSAPGSQILTRRPAAAAQVAYVAPDWSDAALANAMGLNGPERRGKGQEQQKQSAAAAKRKKQFLRLVM